MKLILLLVIGVLLFGCVTVFPKVPSLYDRENKTCTYYLYHKHYEGK